jgi:hypothetical protein
MKRTYGAKELLTRAKNEAKKRQARDYKTVNGVELTALFL